MSENRMPISTLLVKASSNGGRDTGKNEMSECFGGWNETSSGDSGERPKLWKFDSREQQEKINHADVPENEFENLTIQFP